MAWMACLTPLALLVYGALTGTLGANPVERITHRTGLTTLVLLLTGLAITPLRRWTGMPWLIQYRRLVGLFAFFYGCLHLLTYLWFDKLFDFEEIWKDVARRRFITVGFAAFVLMLPLAATSTKGWIRRLGGKRWQFLHRLIYLSAFAGVVHYYWLVKSDIRLPALFATLVAALLLYRLVASIMRRMRERSAAVKPAPVES